MGINRFTINERTNSKVPPPETMLLEILQSEFPFDPLYEQGLLSTTTTTATTVPVVAPNSPDMRLTAPRNSSNNISVYSGSLVKLYTEYTIDKGIPTADEKILDNLFDEEWQFYIETNSGAYKPAVTRGKFLVPTEVQLNPIDYHHAYLSSGPELLETLISQVNAANTNITSKVFCVYYINNDTAYPIPNYKTLEVMLVERGMTYADIGEATNEQQIQFDMVFDGVFKGDITLDKSPDPVEEFKFRKMPDRTYEWTPRIRYDSGYVPVSPFKRDPGDYLKPRGFQSNNTNIERFTDEDPNDLYFDMVFQGQTNRELLREKYEGKLVIKYWPYGYDEETVLQTLDYNFDDLVYSLRLMTNGYWKQVLDPDVLRLKAARENINLAKLDETSVYGPLYGENGFINLFVDINQIEPLQIDQDTIAEASSISQNVSKPVWNDFPHIIEADRLDYQEYLDYLDYYSNNNQPFNIDYLKPYEPAGSIKYYPEKRVLELQEQAALQNSLTTIKEQILEIAPSVVTLIENLELRLKGVMQQSFEDYFKSVYSPTGDLFRILVASDSWKYVKKKNVKDEHKSLMYIFENNLRISSNFSRQGADNIVYINKWGIVPDMSRDTNINIVTTAIAGAAFAEALAIASVVATPLSILTFPVSAVMAANAVAFAGFIANKSGKIVEELVNGIYNAGQHELPRNNDGTRDRQFIKQSWYINLMISLEAQRRLSLPTRNPDTRIADDIRSTLIDLNMYDRIKFADSYLPTLQNAIIETKDLLASLNDVVLNSTDINQLQDIYTSMREIIDLFNNADKGTFQYCLDTKEILDEYITAHINDLYQSIEYIRSVVYGNIGVSDNFGIIYPDSVKSIISKWVPAAKFTNYIPEQWEE